MTARGLKTVLMLAGLGLLAGCGAPTKSAGAVAHLFAGDASDLQDKVSGLCDTLDSRDEAPTAKGLAVKLNGCSNAGLAALDYRKVKSFHFIGNDGGDPPAADQVIHKSVRAQVWLNKSLLGLAQALSKQMQKNSGDEGGLIELPDSMKSGGLSGLVKPEIRMIEKADLDMETLKFSMKIALKMTGAVNIDNDILVDGQLIDNLIAVTVKTGEDRAYERSLLKNFNAVALIVPHAGDVYLDLFVDLNAHNVGLEGLFKSQLDTFLGSGLKTMIDGIMTL